MYLINNNKIIIRKQEIEILKLMQQNLVQLIYFIYQLKMNELVVIVILEKVKLIMYLNGEDLIIIIIIKTLLPIIIKKVKQILQNLGELLINLLFLLLLLLLLLLLHGGKKNQQQIGELIILQINIIHGIKMNVFFKKIYILCPPPRLD